MVELSWTTHQVETGGEHIYYEVIAPAAPEGTVVLGHGGAGSHAVWFQQVPVLAPRYRVITWDTRGFGRSTIRTGALDADLAASDLAAVLDDAGVAEPVHLVAQSMGGWWITAFALAQPDRVRSLTYSGTTGGLFTPELEEHFAAVLRAGLQAPPVLGRHFALASDLVDRDPSRAFLYQQLNSLAPSSAPVGGAVARRFDAPAVRALGRPALFVTGAHDAIYPPALLRGAAELVGGRLVELADAGHSAYFEVPEAFNEVLLAHLAAA